MKKIIKPALTVVFLIALMIGATLLYNSLRDIAEPDRFATEPTEETEDPHLTKAPDVKFTDMDGNERTLSEFLGKPIILNFWASWCGPCKSEMPDFQKAYQEYDTQVQFLMVNCTSSPQETMDKAKAFIADSGFTFPVFFDTTGEASQAYSAYTIPMTWFIDQDGYLAAYAQGSLSGNALRQGISMITAEKTE